MSVDHPVINGGEYRTSALLVRLFTCLWLLASCAPNAFCAERGGVDWTSVTWVRLGGEAFTMSDLGPGPYVHLFPDNRLFEAFGGVSGDFSVAEQMVGADLTHKLDNKYYPQPDYRLDVQRRWISDTPPSIHGQAEVSFGGSVDVVPYTSYYAPLQGYTVREWYEKRSRLILQGDRTMFEVDNSASQGVLSVYARTRQNLSLSDLSNRSFEVMHASQAVRTWMREGLVFSWDTEEATRVDPGSEFIDSDGYLIAWLDARVLATGSGADLSARLTRSGGRGADVFSIQNIEVPEQRELKLSFQLCKLELIASGDLQCGPSVGRTASGSFDLDFSVQAGPGTEGFLFSHPGLTAEPSAQRSLARADDESYGIRVRTPGGVTWTSQSGVFLAQPIPEPSTWLLMALGLVLFGAMARNRKQPQANE